MPLVLIISGLMLLAGLILLGVWFIQRRGFGVLNGNRIYSDSENMPGEILYSKTLPLSGKPDYLIKKDGVIYPVEVKSGRTPGEPYENHTMQLMAYCLLVEENFGVRPTGGYLKYPDKEFKLAFTDEAREGIISLVKEIYRLKVSGEELNCNHPEHN